MGAACSTVQLGTSGADPRPAERAMCGVGPGQTVPYMAPVLGHVLHMVFALASLGLHHMQPLCHLAWDPHTAWCLQVPHAAQVLDLQEQALSAVQFPDQMPHVARSSWGMHHM